jgi:hypothetical protein
VTDDNKTVEEGRVIRFDRIGVSVPDPSDGVVGVEGAGVLDEDLVVEGNDTTRQTTLNFVKFAKPRACATTAAGCDAAFARRRARQWASICAGE